MKQSLGIIFLVSVIQSVHSEEAIELQTIKITEQHDDLSARRDAATQRVVIDRNEIESFSVMTIGEVLGKLPGVELKNGGQRARGMSRDSVQILIDGERQGGGAMAASGVLGRMPVENLDRVEILRGSSAEFGGSSALTVNLILKKALSKRTTDMKLGLGLKGDEPNYQISWTETGGSGNFSWSLPIALNFNNTDVNNRLSRQASVNNIRTFWQKEDSNTINNMEHHALMPKLSWRSGKDSFSIAPMFFYGPTDKQSHTLVSQYATPATGDNLNILGKRAADENAMNRMWRVRLDGEKHLGDTKLTGRLSFNRGTRSTENSRVTTNALGTLTNQVENTRNLHQEVNTALRLDQSLGLHLVSMGAEYVKVRNQDDQLFLGNVAGGADYKTSSQDLIAWLQDDYAPQENLTITSGLRIEKMQLASLNNRHESVGVLPSVAARWQLNEQWLFRTSLGAGMKMPKLNEISNATTLSVAANTPTEADVRGNSALKPERSVNFEAVLEHYLAEKAGVLGANLYVRSTTNFTERRVQLEGVRWVERPYNEVDALHYGLELDAKIKMDAFGFKNATAKTHLTLPYGRVDDERLGITRMARDTPRYVLSAGWDQSVPAWQSSYGMLLQVSGRSETSVPDEQRGFSASRTTLDAFWLYQLSPTYHLRLAGQNLFAADTVKRNAFMSAQNEWQLNAYDQGQRSIMLSLEGRW